MINRLMLKLHEYRQTTVDEFQTSRHVLIFSSERKDSTKINLSFHPFFFSDSLKNFHALHTNARLGMCRMWSMKALSSIQKGLQSLPAPYTSAHSYVTTEWALFMPSFYFLTFNFTVFGLLEKILKLT